MCASRSRYTLGSSLQKATSKETGLSQINVETKFYHLLQKISGGLRFGGSRGKAEKGPSDDVITISQP